MTSETSIWSSPPASSASISLLEDEVHVWRLTLDRPVEAFREVMEPDELARADRFYFERDRKHFAVARGFLRMLLGRYLQVDPKSLRFAYGPWGKPSLDAEFRQIPLRFNMSHSHGLALYAVTEEREIGVDVEYMRPDFATDDIAQRFFSAFEFGLLCELPDDDRVAGFF